MPQIVKILVGLPYSGKSTYLNSIPDRTYAKAEQDLRANQWHILSTDYLIDQLCAEQGLTYQQGFEQFIKQATRTYNDCLDAAIKLKRHIIVDRTNVTSSGRKQLIAQVRTVNPDAVIQAIVFQPKMSLEQWLQRISKRTERVVPFNVLIGMANRFEMPTTEEGFDHVITKNS